MMARFLGTADLNLLEAVFEPLRDNPFFAKDRELHYVAANSAMARLCGVRRPADLLGRRASDVFPAAFAKRYEAMDRQVLAADRSVNDKIDLSVGAGAEPIWLIFSRHPVHDENGRVAGVVATARRLKPVDSAHPTYRRLAIIAERLKTRFIEPLGLADLAGIAGVSQSQLERDFVRLFGVTPRDFLHKARIEHALRLLESDRSVAAIAYECGYADHSAFTRRFRSTVGVSPSVYRKHLMSGTRS